MKAHRPSFEALHNLPGLLPISSSRQRDPALHKANKDMKGLSGISWENMFDRHLVAGRPKRPL